MKALGFCLAAALLASCASIKIDARYTDELDVESLTFAYLAPDVSDPYLSTLRETCPGGFAELDGDLEKVGALAHWVHGLWRHSPSNTPTRGDPLSIIEEARSGARFRCTEYAIVLNACLLASGVPSRILFLKTEDTATSASGSTHVVVEAYVSELGKWVMADPQFDAVPYRDGVPLNAVELQGAIRDGDRVDFRSGSFLIPAYYRWWISFYLFYFQTVPDYVPGGANGNLGYLTLVPLDAANPTMYQGRSPVGVQRFTHSLRVFYHKD